MSEKGLSASELYPRLNIVDDLDYDKFREEEAVPRGELFSRTKKLSTSDQPDMQKIVQGDPTKATRGSNKHSKELMEDTDRPLVSAKDTRHVAYMKVNRKQSPCSVRKLRLTC